MSSSVFVYEMKKAYKRIVPEGQPLNFWCADFYKYKKTTHTFISFFGNVLTHLGEFRSKTICKIFFFLQKIFFFANQVIFDIFSCAFKKVYWCHN